MRVLASGERIIWLGIIVLVVAFGVAATRRVSQGPHSINPAGLSTPMARYAHAVIVPADDDLIFISGEGGQDAKGKLVSDDVVAQTRQTMENLKKALAAAGSDFPHVVRMDIYLTDLNHMPGVRKVRDPYLDPRHAPAMTTVKVASLVIPRAKVEINVVAVRSH